MKSARQLAGAASEINDAHSRLRLDERDEIPEREGTLVFETFVLFG